MQGEQDRKRVEAECKNHVPPLQTPCIASCPVASKARGLATGAGERRAGEPGRPPGQALFRSLSNGADQARRSQNGPRSRFPGIPSAAGSPPGQQGRRLRLTLTTYRVRLHVCLKWVFRRTPGSPSSDPVTRFQMQSGVQMVSLFATRARCRPTLWRSTHRARWHASNTVATTAG